MKPKFYIIPGWEETCKKKQYQNLAKEIQNLGFDIVFKNINWKEKLSRQIFDVEPNSVLFGFSMGALLARLVAQENKCALTIFASMTPFRHFGGGEQEKILREVIGKKILDDIKNNLQNKIKSPSVLIYGDKENEKGDILIKNTDHRISENYIVEIKKLLQSKRLNKLN